MNQADAGVSSPCNLDANLCTTDHCNGSGMCVFQSNVMCPAPNPPCEGGAVCNPTTGMCVNQADAGVSTPCDRDANQCTVDHCSGSGQCVQQSTVTCQAANPPCEAGQVCDPATGMCMNQPDAAVSTACNRDANLCTTDHCNGAGQCVFQSNVTCQAAEPPCEGGAVCNPTTGMCVNQPDAAISSPCQPDEDLCTTHHCDGNGECALQDEVECAEPETPCDGGQRCDPETGMCEDAPEPALSTPCEGDADMCTVEHCDGAGECVFLERSDDPLCDNHFKCYREFPRTRFEPVAVELIDQFKATTAEVERPERFCNPVDKNGEGMDDPTAHLNCYRLDEEHFDNVDVIVSNQFGDNQRLTVRRVDSLCVPAIKDEIPSELDINHYKCYKVLRSRGEKRFEEREVMLEDQFETKRTIVKRPKYLCNPVQKNDEPVPSPESHLLCYSIKDARGQAPFDPRPIDVEDQFTPPEVKAVRGDCREVSFLCVPSLKRLASETTTTLSSTTTTTVAVSSAALCGNGTVGAGEECERAGDCGSDGVACERCRCVGAGDVRVTLAWQGGSDLDLHVVDPSGEEIYYDNPTSETGGVLDTSTGPTCEDGSTTNVENVYWPAGTAPAGSYRVLVNYVASCAGDVAPPQFTLTTLIDGDTRVYLSNAITPDPSCGQCMPTGTCICQPVALFSR